MVRAVSIWFWLSYLALATMAAVLSFMVTAQQRKFSHLESEFLRSRDPVPVDAALRLDRELPALTGLRGDYGSESSWEEFFDERSGVLLVLNAACAPCRYLADELNAPAAESILRRAVLVVEGTESEARTFDSREWTQGRSNAAGEPWSRELMAGRHHQPVTGSDRARPVGAGGSGS